ncbi:glycosyl transferase family 90 [Vibrio sp. WXL103]|uniref:glycosyl transferase family 90 n=1 Tax=Vibrio sp. WXL103 TaxID=3450710 RepID=UPI003EC68CDC
MKKLIFYTKNLALNLVPSAYFNYRKQQLEAQFADDLQEIQNRVDYYCKPNLLCELPDDAVSQYNYKRGGKKSAYFYDLKKYLYYFPKRLKFAYYFGDHVAVEPHPTLYKARPIQGDNSTSVLFKLNQLRHFRFVNDTTPFSAKRDMAVFRGAAYQKHRKRFMEKMFDHPLVDAGQTNASQENPQWKKPFMTVEEQLQNKFLICIEGNDVATNLKWALSSNSLVISPKMRFETWFMEGTLKDGEHYIEVKDDWSDFEEKIKFYLSHPEKAEKIIQNAHRHVAQFRNQDKEDLVCIKTLEKYFSVTNS